jgi:hypothetical protein
MKSVIEQRNQFAEQEGSLLSGWAIALYGDANGWDIYQVLESGFEELINPPYGNGNRITFCLLEFTFASKEFDKQKTQVGCQ